jgi:hypothetical protein
LIIHPECQPAEPDYAANNQTKARKQKLREL